MTTWTEALRLGNDVVDAQHQSFFEFMDGLMKDVENGTAVARFPAALDYLIVHFTSHFELEENLMLKHGYPLLAIHRDQHMAFFDLFTTLKAKILRDGPDEENVTKLVTHLKAWLFVHLMESDKGYVDYIKAKTSIF